MNEIECAITNFEEFLEADIGQGDLHMCSAETALAALQSELDRIDPITNADRIRNMTDEDLAKISTYCTTKPDYDCFEIEEWHSVFTADLYDSEEDAINYTIDWLKQAERKHSMIQQEARKNAPTIDAVPVVRCRDCKYYGEYRTNKNKQIMRYCMRMAKNDMEYHVKPDDFCSYGERRK